MNPNSSKPLNPYAPPFLSRAALVPAVREKAAMECSRTSLVCEKKKFRTSARKFISRRKYVNGRRVLHQKIWCPKKNADVVPPPSSSSSVPEPQMFNGTTSSVMIKNIPNQFESDTLVDILDKHCREENTKTSSDADKPNFIRSEYDFLYLPMDFRRGANKGYAFVNFTTAVAASRFAKAFEEYHWRVSVSRKICQVTIAKIQGKDALQNHFKNSAFPCRRDSYLPVVFSPPRDGFVRTQATRVGRRV
ncbi:protein MEI2-like 5 [Tripterygium wilfordii]|uniref:Protein MEI2-like 5 n=1 Tax=Tripterygium wilfordii TaxID=458696 RepID=A0A7J7D1Z0_TRIWF|nr:protein MEI2-like 5 [Tripterygium wilfordii]